MADETVVVDPSPAEPVEVEELTDEQRSTWETTGDLPVKPKTEEPAPSKPADAAGEKQAASADGKKAESGTAKKSKPDQERNWRQLEAKEREARQKADSLEKELNDLKAKAGAKPAEEKTAASLAATGEPQAPERPKRPRLTEFTDPAKFDEAMDKYEEAMPAYYAQVRAFEDAKSHFEKQRTAFTERQGKIFGAWKTIGDKGIELYGKDEFMKYAFAADLPIVEHDPVERYLRDSEPEIAAHLLQYLGLRRQDLTRIIGLSSREQFRELEAVETAMREELNLGGKPAAKVEPPKKEVTAAGKPPVEVGGKGPATGDEEDAALKAGDTDRYIELANAREIAARRAGRR